MPKYSSLGFASLWRPKLSTARDRKFIEERLFGEGFEGLWLDVPKEVAKARVAARTADASDATPDVVERQFGYDLGSIGWRRG